eukprot:g2425.t1
MASATADPSREAPMSPTGTTAPLRRPPMMKGEAPVAVAGGGAPAGKAATGGEVDLFARTWESLDFGVVLERLSAECRTEMGRVRALVPDFKTTLEEVHELYERVSEVLLLAGDAVPLRSGMSVERQLAIAADGSTLEAGEIASVASALEGLFELREFFCGATADAKSAGGMVDRSGKTPRLAAVAAEITLDEGLLALLRGAFDSQGELSAERFPEIGRLRSKVASLRQGIKSTMNKLMAGGEFSGMLADEGREAYVSEIAGRFVIPVTPTYKRTVGIVHDSSRTGKTLYVEPSQVVGPTNEMVEAKLQLKVETQRILSQMTLKIAEHEDEILRSLAAAGEVDLALARGRLGTKTRGTIPKVMNEGTIKLVNARHPVLLLRGKTPVGNDMSLDGSMQALILTGPNAGGKTVVLKTLGLVALMTRAGIPIPAEPGARVDLFDPVLADIGDLQSVTGDLSTFSGHLVVAKAVLSGAKAGSLVLMDEMGSGTDPMQGAALAQSLLEALVDAGSRVALTTHYTQLKELAAADDRFGVSAMQFVDGRPTYRLIKGAVGESFALQVAERLELPAFVVDRARNLLDDNTRQVSELISKLEDERNQLQEQLERAATREAEVLKQLKKLAEEREEAAELRSTAKRDAAKEYATKLDANEKKLKQMFDKARNKPTTNVIGSSIGEIRALKKEVEQEAAAPTYSAEDLGLTPLKKRDKLARGETVVVCDGTSIGWEGEVLSTSNRDVEVFLPSAEASMRFAFSQLSRVPPGGVKWPSQSPSGGSLGKKRLPGGAGPPAGGEVVAPRRKTGTSRRVAQYLEDDAGSLSSGGDGGTNRRRKKGSGDNYFVRTERNTLDLRGMTLSEAQDDCDMFFSASIMDDVDGVYLLHGHGTGILKAGIRRWLPRNSMVAKWRPATQEDGGDAYTVVELK